MTATNERALRHAGHVYIGGKWVKPEQTEPLDVINPATEECVAHVAQAGVADVKRTIAAARTAFDRGDWVRTAPAARAARLRIVAGALGDRLPELARGLPLEMSDHAQETTGS